ncbi:MAG TPA: hypothetical protein VF516_38950, partial [Kofleriaceae bacterium]
SRRHDRQFLRIRSAVYNVGTRDRRTLVGAARRPTDLGDQLGPELVALAGDVAQAQALDAEHRRDRGEAEELEPHRVTSSAAIAGAGAPWGTPATSTRPGGSVGSLCFEVAQ